MNIKNYIAKILMLSMAFSFFVAADENPKNEENKTPDDYVRDMREREEQTEKFERGLSSLFWRIFRNKCEAEDINNGKEFINMRTTLSYYRYGSSEPETRTYGDKERPSKALKPFPRNIPLNVNVKFFPEMQNKEMYGCKFGGVPVRDLLLYVEIRMEKTNDANITVKYVGGITEDRVKVERDFQGPVTYSLHIKAVPENSPEARFTITPGMQTAEMKMKITYRAVSNYVNRDSDIVETVEFIKVPNRL